MPLTEIYFWPLPWSLIKFPPADKPDALPPPNELSGILTPFEISPELYNYALQVRWPLSVAAGYAATVFLLNAYNKSRGNKPWAISRSGLFTLFVLAHNIFLTLYSAWTFVGMFLTMQRVFGGILDEYETYGIVPMVDALCKMSGPRGLGQAASFDPLNSRWGVKNVAVELLNGAPDPTDVGRLWNEGLAFYGWLFYLSKFYEVIDTLIILAKGKRSSLLQTYHHAGAMMCMWAGIRYMSPPIWMFVQFNSGIHALMYFYYTLAALGVRVPSTIKRSLTTLQISQFIIGASFAISHLFVAYQIPVNTPYVFTHAVTSAAASAASSASSALPTATSVAAGIGNWLKKVALRAAGNEGLAENVRDSAGNRFGIDAVKADISDAARQEIRYRLEYPSVHCIDTSGQAFAIWLNFLYLLPLTYLFGRFFVTSYLKRAKAEKDQPTLQQRMVRSSSDAAKGVDREIRQAMGDKQGYNSPIDDEFSAELQMELDRIKGKVTEGAVSLKSESDWLASIAKEKAGNAVNSAHETVTVKKEESKPIIEQISSTVQETTEVAKQEVVEVVQSIKETVSQTVTETMNWSSQVIESTSTSTTEQSSSNMESHTGHQQAISEGSSGSQNAHTAQLKEGESYADAVKVEPDLIIQPEQETEAALDDSTIEVSHEDATAAQRLEINPDANMSGKEKEAEAEAGQQPDDSGLFG